MGGYLIFPCCPRCGSTKFRMFHDDQSQTLRALRECKECGVCYEPPTPRRASAVALAIGAVLLIGGAAAAWFVPASLWQLKAILAIIALSGNTVMVLSSQQLRRGKAVAGPPPGRNGRTPAAPNS